MAPHREICHIFLILHFFVTVNIPGVPTLGIANINFMQKSLKVDLQTLLGRLFRALTTKFPLIQNLYSIAFMVWTTFFCAFVLALKKRAKYIIVLLPLIAIWGTMMIAAPTFCEFRYMFSFHLALPFVVLLMFVEENKSCLRS